MNWEIGTNLYTLICIKYIICCIAQGTPLCCTVETNTTLLNNYTSIKKEKKIHLKILRFLKVNNFIISKFYFCLFLSRHKTFVSFPCLITMIRHYTVVLNKRHDSGFPCFFSGLKSNFSQCFIIKSIFLSYKLHL